MLNDQASEQTARPSQQQASAFRAPSISQPKGGGAIRGIGEKFGANPATGTGSMSIPIATSPGRSGFGPQLSLTYDSGAGNGPFGLGCSLSLPSITRKTDKGLPRYNDSEEGDVFILSGSEDLMPVLEFQNGAWTRTSLERILSGDVYAVERYRPRIEGLFARIERWTRIRDGDTHWRSISRDNVTTHYGKTTESRIVDPEDPSRIFSWLICESYDDKGNTMVYGYAAEDSSNVDASQANERNRDQGSRSINRYIKRIRYGNTTSRLIQPDLTQLAWLFEIVFDYGEGHIEALAPDVQGREFVRATLSASGTWPSRQDAFSSHRSGFEVRTYRLCRRVLMFHHFLDELGVPDYLVRSMDFTYRETPIVTVLTSVTQSGYRRQNDGTYLRGSLPPLEFEYNEAVVQEQVNEVDSDSLANLPGRVDGTRYQWLDLDGEGLPCILTEEDDGWYYKRNVSALCFGFDNGTPAAQARFEPVSEVATLPSFAEASSSQHQFLDLAGDGQLDCVMLQRSAAGFFKRTEDQAWDPFKPLPSLPNVDWDDPNLRFIDLDGDGHADVLITENDALTWYPSLAEGGFGPAERAPKASDEEDGPAVVFADADLSIHLADMSGDGLSDIVRIRNAEVCYWPNLGYGRFGRKIVMDNAPWFEAPEQFDPKRIRLADIDGSGVTDIIYLGRDGVRLYFNQSGNGWRDARTLSAFPLVDNLSGVQVLDLLGNGTACLVWMSPLPGDTRRSMRYVDLMGGQKPHLLTRSRNNLGAETSVFYAPSTKFYLADRAAGNPWLSRLPFPVHVVERVETVDHVSRNRFVSRYVYHHGYFDGAEREFRGFGMVEQFDGETSAGEPQGVEAGSYQFFTVDLPGATSTFLLGISDTGRIVGQQRDANGLFHSLLTDTRSFSTFDPPGFNSTSFPGISFANGINDGGELVGGVKNNEDSGSQAYVKKGNDFSLFSHPDAGSPATTSFEGINNAGVRVGSFFDKTGTSRGIIQNGDAVTLLENVVNVPDNAGTFIFDINNLGHMVGGYFDPVGEAQHGFFTDGVSFTTIDFPGSSITWLNGINDLGQMVGAYLDDAGGVYHSFWTDGNTFSVVDFPDAPGQHPGTFLTGIDNAGRIVGYYGDDLDRANKGGIHGLFGIPIASAYTKSWFHTGANFDQERISKHFEAEYYRESDMSEGIAGLSKDEFEAMSLPDTALPTDLSPEEMREASRALKGAILRQEVYALDGTDAADRPYVTSERNYTVRRVQPFGPNRHAVFFTHARETIEFHYERMLFDVGNRLLADPRVTHNMVLAVDEFGNELKSVAIGYGRRHDDPDPLLRPEDRAKQKKIQLTYSENAFSNPVLAEDDYRVPLLVETRTYELIKVTPDRAVADITNLFGFDEISEKAIQASDGRHDLPYEDVDAQGAVENHGYRRLIEQTRMVYRKDDLSGALPLGVLEPLALPFESYKLAFTPGLLGLYRRGQDDLLPNPAGVLRDEGGYVLSDDQKATGLFPPSDPDGHWWIPSGRLSYSPNAVDTASQELGQARAHFFLARRYRDPFGNESKVTFDSHDLLLVETEDALQNKITAGERGANGSIANRNEYTVLQAALVTDPNGNCTEMAFDALGLVAGTAVMGKATEKLGDSLIGFVADLSQQQIDEFFVNPKGPSAAGLLTGATARIVYDVGRFKRAGNTITPVFAATIARETHVNDLAPNESSKLQVSFAYSDGFGREVQKKIQAEPGPVIKGGPLIRPRWVGSGWTVFNDKGDPVRQYEPFFDDTHDFRFSMQVGVSSTLFYDPLRRAVATLHPNHTWEKVVFDPWRQQQWDVNDTVLIQNPKLDPDVGSFFRSFPDADYLPTWHASRIRGQLGADEQGAATKAASHANTPAAVYFDTVGRTFLTIANNRFKRQDTTVEESYSTRVGLDIEGNQRTIKDAAVQAGDLQGRIVMRYDYDLLGNRIHQASMEAGERWMLNDVAGMPIRAWNSREHAFRTVYDALHRPIKLFVQGADPNSVDREILFEQTTYGEGVLNNQSLNLRTRAFRHFDSAGIVTNAAYDFKGNLLRRSREIAPDYKGLIDWNETQPPGEALSTSTIYDALNRPTAVATPDRSVYQPTYNEANLLGKVEVSLQGVAIATPFVTHIEYDAKGQRTQIDYATRDGKGISTTYTRDPDTFRLLQLTTNRGGIVAQDLRYTYDPAANITHIRDDAQQTVYFNGEVVEPDFDYTYDAIYRLIKATGREHIGQLAQPETTWDDGFRVNLPHPQDGQVMRNYTEQYEYDAIGNFGKLTHQAANGSWTRLYDYNEASLLEPGKKSNRLSSTTVGRSNGNPPLEIYRYDAHGNMSRMPHLTTIEWDFKDQLRASSKQAVNSGTPETTFYVYDASGQRVRKVTERQNGSRKEERIYFGGSEVYRRYGESGNTVTLERETLHVIDDKQRIALVEVRTQGEDGSPDQLIRYQFGNHLGSASLELDDQARVISYEEYYPYGSTSYQAVNRATNAASKRYRHTGKERDEETGLCYHGARYYAPWVGRWVSCDPKGITEGMCLYQYVSANPLRFFDPDGKGEAAQELLQEAVRHGPKLVLLTGLAANDNALALGAAGTIARGGAIGALVVVAIAVPAAVYYYTRSHPVPYTKPSESRTPTPPPASVTAAPAGPVPPPAAVKAPKQPVDPETGRPSLDASRQQIELHVPQVPKKDEPESKPTAGGGGSSKPPDIDDQDLKFAPPRKKTPHPSNPTTVPNTQEASALFIHNAYGQSILGRPRNEVPFELNRGSRLESRIADDYDPTTGILSEFNTTPWRTMSAEKLEEKIKQVGKDLDLIRSGRIKGAIWYGTEALPETGRGGQLRRALEGAGIEYRVIPLPPNLKNLRPPP